MFWVRYQCFLPNEIKTLQICTFFHFFTFSIQEKLCRKELSKHFQSISKIGTFFHFCVKCQKLKMQPQNWYVSLFSKFFGFTKYRESQNFHFFSLFRVFRVFSRIFSFYRISTFPPFLKKTKHTSFAVAFSTFTDLCKK